MTISFEEEVKQLVSEIIEVPIKDLKPDADLINDLGIDSLKAIEIVAAIEKKYRVIIPEKDIPKLRNLNKIIDFTKKLKK
ncbi:acyl carrier protein [Candidatus Desantisbacteria bacterium]|nr:acyl carrier protein [Candidatus Desantisbacteria bacterium]